MISLYPFKSYDEYRDAQVQANWDKRHRVFTCLSTLELISCFIPGTPKFGLCHGSRTGQEQVWFRQLFPGCEVWGTEIGPTAKTAPWTIEWDFHEVHPNWPGRCDFIYSNSLDHAYDPAKAVRAWLSCLKKTGVLLLERENGPVHASDADKVDCFRAELSTFDALLKDWGGTITLRRPVPNSAHRWYYVVRRA